MDGYQTTSLKPSSLGSPMVLLASGEPARTRQYPSKGVTANSRGGTGSLTFEDQDGAQIGYVNWENGRMLTDGAQTIECGSDDSSSSGT